MLNKSCLSSRCCAHMLDLISTTDDRFARLWKDFHITDQFSRNKHILIPKSFQNPNTTQVFSLAAWIGADKMKEGGAFFYHVLVSNHVIWPDCLHVCFLFIKVYRAMQYSYTSTKPCCCIRFLSLWMGARDAANICFQAANTIHD